MKIRNKILHQQSFFSSLFISSLLVTTLILGTSCGSNQSNQTGGQPTPPAPPATDPLVTARQAFHDKVWTPYLASDRCVHCHDFVNQAGKAPPAGFTHPALVSAGGTVVPTLGFPAAANQCNGCHTSAVFPFPTATYPNAIWQDVPVSMVWNAQSVSDDVRTKIIANEGANLCKHLIGEGADAAPVVQWGFANSPDIPTNPPTPGDFHGKTPGPYATPLLDWPSYKTAVSEWLCLEAKVPGAPDLGAKAPCLVCP